MPENIGTIKLDDCCDGPCSVVINGIQYSIVFGYDRETIEVIATPDEFNSSGDCVLLKGSIAAMRSIASCILNITVIDESGRN